jgi:thymidylate synthase
MITIKEQNVNGVFARGIQLLREQGVLQDSQHGQTLEMPEPVSVMYLNPRERILFDEKRDSNPFLNLFEALWIIAGRNDVQFLKELVGRMATFSDDGVTYYGAYGHRLRYEAGAFAGEFIRCDQIEEAVLRLIKNPDDRQVVLTIRAPHDMFYTGKDQPCNLLVSCKIRNGKLNIHVFNRSNDFIWGLTGTNVVQFSMLQEYLAGRIGVPVGTYHQTTDSCHVYVNEQWEKLKDTSPDGKLDPYATVQPYDMMEDPDAFDEDLIEFFHQYDNNTGMGITRLTFKSKFFQEVIFPAWYSFMAYKDFRDTGREGALEGAKALAEEVPADWGLAISQWLSRRGVAK